MIAVETNCNMHNAHNNIITARHRLIKLKKKKNNEIPLNIFSLISLHCCYLSSNFCILPVYSENNM